MTWWCQLGPGGSGGCSGCGASPCRHLEDEEEKEEEEEEREEEGAHSSLVRTTLAWPLRHRVTDLLLEWGSGVELVSSGVITAHSSRVVSQKH